MRIKRRDGLLLLLALLGTYSAADMIIIPVENISAVQPFLWSGGSSVQSAIGDPHDKLINLNWSRAGHIIDMNFTISPWDVNATIAWLNETCIQGECRTTWPIEYNTTAEMITAVNNTFWLNASNLSGAISCSDIYGNQSDLCSIVDTDTYNTTADMSVALNNSAQWGAVFGNFSTVGIGTTTPDNTLEVVGDGVRIADSGGVGAVINVSGSNFNMDWYSALDRNINLLNSGSGNVKVGIGTDSPAVQLEVEDADNTYINIDTSVASKASQIIFSDQGTFKWVFGKKAGNDFGIFDSADNDWIISMKTGGYVGIGTTEPQHDFDIVSSVGANNYAMNINATGNSGEFLSFTNDLGIRVMAFMQSSPGAVQALFADENGNIAAKISADGNLNYVNVLGGNFGVGTATPDSPLHVKTTGTTVAKFESDTWAGLYINSTGATDGSLYLVSGGDNAWRLHNDEDQSNTFTVRDNSGGIRLAVETGGDVGIGIQDPTNDLHIYRNSGVSSLMVESASANDAELYLKAPEGERGEIITFNDTGDIRSRIVFPVSDGDIQFLVNGANDLLYLDGPTERIGIGDSSPGARLHLVTDGAGSASGLYMEDGQNNEVIAVLGQQTGVTANGEGILSLYSSGSEKIRLSSRSSTDSFVNSGGDFGIGTSNPTWDLHVNESGGHYHNMFKVEYTDTVYSPDRTSFLSVSDQQAVFVSEVTGGATALYVQDADNNAARLALDIRGARGSNKILSATSTGLVGIGTTAPSHELNVVGDANVTGDLIVETDADIEGDVYVGTRDTNVTIDSDGFLRLRVYTSYTTVDDNDCNEASEVGKMAMVDPMTGAAAYYMVCTAEDSIHWKYEALPGWP